MRTFSLAVDRDASRLKQSPPSRAGCYFTTGRIHRDALVALWCTVFFAAFR